MIDETVQAFFVYGTLKTGQCREKCWPRRPQEIRRAWTMGELYDTGPYPALFPGGDTVGGQVWIFDPSDMASVIQELDQVEEYRPGHEATNLYNRHVVECTDDQSRIIRAFTYIYARADERATFTRLWPTYSTYSEGERRLVIWPLGADW